MPLSDILQNLSSNGRFTLVEDLCLSLYVPETRAEALRAAIGAVWALRYGDYEQVSFQSAEGTQFFRSTGAGRNASTQEVVSVPCLWLTVQVPRDPALLEQIIKTIFEHHPYEEPVITLTPSLSTRHIRGLDEDNPNRFWNAASPETWVPDAHK